jgi:23S rRNA (cytidine2498-2'-O)-methyltransferase
MNTLLLHCRPGFEGEVCAELAERASLLNIPGYARSKPASAFAEFVCSEPDGADRLMKQIRFSELIFPRQWARGEGFITLHEKDRIGVILQHLQAYPVCGSVWFEVLDTNEGKALSTFCKKFEKPLLAALTKAGRLQDDPTLPRLQLTFRTGTDAFIGIAEPRNAAFWPMGIPRLKFPRAAPSRSTLKLEEAWHQFIPRNQWDERLASGMHAVDLGAAPGGWTWQLVNREMLVTAVDNGPMAPALMDTGLIEHLQVDGYAYRPRQGVDWMVCDIVEKPARTAALMESWIGEKWCREAVVNLKLPMKQRYGEVRRILDRLKAYFEAKSMPVSISCKQLYHIVKRSPVISGA